MTTSRIPGFYKMDVNQRRELLEEQLNLTLEKKDTLYSNEELDLEKADKMIENLIGTFQLPISLGLNFLINNKEYKIPMAVEEPSIIASASYIAKLVRDAGGFKTEATERVMIGQIQVVGSEDFNLGEKTIVKQKKELHELSDEA